MRLIGGTRAGLLVAALLAVLTACTSAAPVSREPEPAGESVTVGADGARLTLGTWTVAVPAGTQAGATLSATVADAPARPPLDGLQSVGDPVALELSSGPPDAGATIAYRLPDALPEDQALVLAYLDEASDEWTPVPATLSSDRRTLTADTPHFSIWAVWRYAVNQWLGKRADPPQCEGSLPDWVGSVEHLIDLNAPVSYCAGRDPQDAGVLVVKFSVNRGYGMFTTTAADPAWRWSSAPNVFALADWFQRAGGAMTGVSGTFVPPGEEVALGFREDAVRSVGTAPLVRVTGDPRSLLASFLLQQLADVLGSQISWIGVGVAVAAVGACAWNLPDLAALGGIPGCLADNAEIIYRAAVDAAVAADPGLAPRAAAQQLSGLLRALAWVRVGLTALDVQELVGDFGPFREGRATSTGGDLTALVRRPAPPPRPTGAVTLGLGGALGDLGIYAPESDTVAYLTGRLGPPDSTATDGICPGGDIPGTRLIWGPLTVRIAADATNLSYLGMATGPATVGWSYTAGAPGDDPLRLTTAEGIGLGSSLSAVRSAYPVAVDGVDAAGAYVDVFMGDASNIVFRARDGGLIDTIESGSGCGS